MSLVKRFHCKIVTRGAVRFLCVLSLMWIAMVPFGIHAQQGRKLHPLDEGAYGANFFDQLRSLFGKFRSEDLGRAFRTAQPIQCFELVANSGEWRTVAFFNEDRSLGEWCRGNIEEVKEDLSIYTFKGACRGDHGTIQVTTEFPVLTSIDLYNAAKIGLDEVDVKVNPPVNAIYDAGTRAYTFELPYLFLTGGGSGGNVYSMNPQQAEDRYATEVTSRWECKAVKSSDMTYRFLICRTATWPRNIAVKKYDLELSFGASAYFILSDGLEAQTSVSLTFGGSGRGAEAPRAEHPTSPTSLTGLYGNEPVRNPSWISGIPELVNSPNRYGGYFVNAQDVFCYRGSAGEFNAFLSEYGKLAGTTLVLLIHVGPKDILPWPDQLVRFDPDWTLYAAPKERSMYQNEPDAPDFVTRVDVWVDRNIRPQDIKIPKTVTVK